METTKTLTPEKITNEIKLYTDQYGKEDLAQEKAHSFGVGFSRGALWGFEQATSSDKTFEAMLDERCPILKEEDWEKNALLRLNGMYTAYVAKITERRELAKEFYFAGKIKSSDLQK